MRQTVRQRGAVVGAVATEVEVVPRSMVTGVITTVRVDVGGLILSVIVLVVMVISTIIMGMRMQVAVDMTVERTTVRKLVQELAELGLRLLLLRVQRLARVDEPLDRVTQAGEVGVSLRRRGDALNTAKSSQDISVHDTTCVTYRSRYLCNSRA